jgi:hypothetical protein
MLTERLLVDAVALQGVLEGQRSAFHIRSPSTTRMAISSVEGAVAAAAAQSATDCVIAEMQLRAGEADRDRPIQAAEPEALRAVLGERARPVALVEAVAVSQIHLAHALRLRELVGPGGLRAIQAGHVVWERVVVTGEGAVPAAPQCNAMATRSPGRAATMRRM